jgi:hypothetical protein
MKKILNQKRSIFQNEWRKNIEGRKKKEITNMHLIIIYLKNKELKKNPSYNQFLGKSNKNLFFFIFVLDVTKNNIFIFLLMILVTTIKCEIIKLN